MEKFVVTVCSGAFCGMGVFCAGNLLFYGVKRLAGKLKERAGKKEGTVNE